MNDRELREAQKNRERRLDIRRTHRPNVMSPTYIKDSLLMAYRQATHLGLPDDVRALQGKVFVIGAVQFLGAGPRVRATRVTINDEDRAALVKMRAEIKTMGWDLDTILLIVGDAASLMVKYNLFRIGDIQ